MNARAEQILQAWFSQSYPIGAFAYSHGLEQEIATGRVVDADTLIGWLAAVLRFGTGRNDAIFLAQAWRGEDVSALAEVLAPSSERHLEAMAQGRAFAKVTREVYAVTVPDAPFPVAVGRAAAALDLPLEACMRHYLHGMTNNLISAAVRFVPLGQTEGQRVLTALFPTILDVATAAADADLEDLGGMVPGADVAAIEHEVLSVRIFRT